MAKERIGQLKVTIKPEFDQAELFRQVKAATSKLPKLQLGVKISAKAVNDAIREVNKKKLVAIKPPVQITAFAVNKAIREVNRKKLTAIKVPIDFKNAKSVGRDLANTEKSLNRTTKSATRLGQEGRQEIGKFAASFTFLRTALASVRISAIGTAFGFVAQAASGAAAAITQLTAALSFGAIGGIGFLAQSFTAFGQALGVVKFASAGLGKALKGLNEELDPVKFAALTPAAQKFAQQLQNLKPLIRGIQQNLQEGLFSGLSDSVKNLTPLILKLTPILEGTARTLGLLAENASRALIGLGGPLARILTANNTLIKNLGSAVIDLAASFVLIVDSISPLSIGLSEIVARTAAAIRKFIEAKNASGELRKFFVKSSIALKSFGKLALAAGIILVNIFKAALPVGLTLLITVEELALRLAKFTGSTKGRNSIAEFFKKAQPAIQSAGMLVQTLALAFFELSQQPGLIILLDKLRTDLIPTLTKGIETVTREFGPVLISSLVSILTLFTTLASAGGPVNTLAIGIGILAKNLNDLFVNNPKILQFAASLLALEAVLTAGGLVSFIAKSSGLVKVFTSSLRALTLALSETAAFAGGGFVGVLARFAGALGIVIIAVETLISFTKEFYTNLKNGVPTIQAFFLALSVSVLSSVKNILKGFDLIFEAVNKLATVKFKVAGKEFDFGIPKIASGAKVGRKEVSLLTGEIDKLIATDKSLGKSLAAPKKLRPIGPEFTDDIKRGIEAENQSKEMQARILADVKRTQKMFGDINRQSVLDAVKFKKALADSQKTVDPLKGSIDATNASLGIMRNRLSALGEVVSQQKSLVDSYKQALDELKNVQLEGTKAFDDQKFAIDQQIKSLELQQVQLKLSGQTDESQPIKDLKVQIEKLQLQAQQTDLTESLQLDPLRRKFKDATDPIKELSFNSAISQFTALTAAHTVQNNKLKLLEATYDSLQGAINRTEGGVKRLTAGVKAQFTTIPPAALGQGTAAGQALIGGLETGIRSQLAPGTKLTNLLSKEIPDHIRKNKGPISYDQTILVPAGVAIMDGLAGGLRKGFEPVKSYLKSVGPSLEEYVPESVFAKRTAEFMVEVAAGKKPDPNKFFADLVPTFPAIDFQAGGLTGSNPFQAIEALFNLKRSSGDHDAPGVHAAGSYHYRPAPWGGVQAYDYGDAINSVATLLQTASFAKQHAGLFAEAFYDKFGSYVKNGQVVNGPFGGHGDHVHLAFKTSAGAGLGSPLKGAKTPFDGIFQAASAAFNIPAAVLKAVTKAESGFNPRAGSGAGAQGLMQLLPATFLAQHVGSNIFDPKQNIFAGAKYLSTQLKKFKSLRLALAAYNAGPGNASLALGSFGETIAYVSRVLSFLKDFGGFRAMGGPVSTGSSFIVGERGPELFMPRRNGQIISNKDIKDMANILREIRDTGGLRQHTTTITSAIQDPEILAQMMDNRERRKLRKLDLA